MQAAARARRRGRAARAGKRFNARQDASSRRALDERDAALERGERRRQRDVDLTMPARRAVARRQASRSRSSSRRSRRSSASSASRSRSGPKPRPSGTTSARSTSRRIIRRWTCTTRSTSSDGGLLRTHTSPVQMRTLQKYRAADSRAHARATSTAAISSTRRTRRCSRRSKAWRRRRHQLRRPQGDAQPFRQALLRRDEDALPPELLPVHRAVGRDGRRVPALSAASGCAGVQGHRAGSRSSARAWCIRRARSRGRRQRALHRLGVRHGAGAHRDAALRHSRHPNPLRFRRALPGADRANERLVRVAARVRSVRRSTPAELRDLLTSRVATVDELDRAARRSRADRRRARRRSRRRIRTPITCWSRRSMPARASCSTSCAARRTSRRASCIRSRRSGTVMPGGLKIEKRKIRGADLRRHALLGARARARREHEGILELDDRRRARARRSSTRCRSATRGS